MNASIIQAMIARNAAAITRENAMMRTFIEFAKDDSARGEKAFATDFYKKADKKRAKVAKLAVLQRAMIAQLKASYRAIRIEKKLARLNALFDLMGKTSITMNPESTSREQEEHLDILLGVYA